MEIFKIKINVSFYRKIFFRIMGTFTHLYKFNDLHRVIMLLGGITSRNKNISSKMYDCAHARPIQEIDYQADLKGSKFGSNAKGYFKLLRDQI